MTNALNTQVSFICLHLVGDRNHGNCLLHGSFCLDDGDRSRTVQGLHQHVHELLLANLQVGDDGVINIKGVGVYNKCPRNNPEERRISTGNIFGDTL